MYMAALKNAGTKGEFEKELDQIVEMGCVSRDMCTAEEVEEG